MLIGKIHPGSGLGDQLFSYIVTRVIALDKGYDFGFVGKEFFKGKDFMQLDWGEDILVPQHIEPSTGELICDFELINDLFKFDKPYYDPEVNFIEDGTIIDGYGAQDERYWGHRLDEIREWLKVELVELEARQIVLNIRGGEYKSVPELFLAKEYWDKSIIEMKRKQINKHEYSDFQVHTDDPELAMKWFTYPVIKSIGTNWKSLRYAKNAIISNSAFAIIPRLLKHLEDPEAVTIAPRYWAGRNVGEWRRPQNYYKKFNYI